jgi:hypothetical protein
MDDAPSITALVELKAAVDRNDAGAAAKLVAARERFLKEHGKDTYVGLFPVAGVFLSRDRFRWAVQDSTLKFDWSEAHRLIYRLDAIADQAQEWWQIEPEEDHQDNPNPDRARDSGRERRARVIRRDRRPHLERVYGLMTAIFAAMQRENGRTGAATDKPSERYLKNLDLLRPEVTRADGLLRIAGQRSAQIRYGRGMFWGLIGLLVLCGALGVAIGLGGVPAWNGVAFLAGGLGAMVSVLQRMTRGNLDLDLHAGERMLAVYGAVRPFMGGIFGMVVFVILEGGLAIDVSTDAPLAFYAAVGFLAGFNERFAQDMFAGSAKRLLAQTSAGEDDPRAERTGTAREVEP